MLNQTELELLLTNDLYGDSGLISAMGNGKKKDIPAAQELLITLQSALKDNQCPFISSQQPKTSVYEAIYFFDNKIMVYKKFCESKMKYSYFWTVPSLPGLLKQEEGYLVFMYSLEEKNKELHIFPEWFSLFCFGESYQTLFPQLTMTSLIEEPQYSNVNWLEMALIRATVYGFNTDIYLQKLRTSSNYL